MSGGIDVQLASDVGGLISREEVVGWVLASLPGENAGAEITVRIVGESEGARLNRVYRNARGATNVLAFEFEPPPGVTSNLLGDVVVCGPVVEREAREQDKAVRAHCAHMVVHGTLHLLGYEHQSPEQAERMESLERLVMKRLGFPDPYAAARP